MFEDILLDKTLKPKERKVKLSDWLLQNPGKINKLIEFAAGSKDPVKATCIEVLEFATKTKPSIAGDQVLAFVPGALAEKAPRIKWESARVIGNIAALYPTKLDEAINNLLVNTEHPGMVVRWSAAYALGEIIRLKTKHNHDLVPAIEVICRREEQNSIKKIYLAALKKIGHV